MTKIHLSLVSQQMKTGEYANIFLCHYICIHSIEIHYKKERKRERERASDQDYLTKLWLWWAEPALLLRPSGETSSSQLNDLEPVNTNGSTWTGSFPGCGSSRLIETHQRESRCGAAAAFLGSATDLRTSQIFEK